MRVRSQPFFSPGMPILRRGRKIRGPGCTPDPSLREFEVDVVRPRAGLGESRHRRFLVRPSRRPGPSQSLRRRERDRARTRPSRSRGHLRLTLAAGEERPRALRRCNRFRLTLTQKLCSPVNKDWEWNILCGYASFRTWSLPPCAAVVPAAVRRRHTLPASSACARGSSPGGASPPPARSSILDAA